MAHGDNQSASPEMSALAGPDGRTLRPVERTDEALKLISGFAPVSEALKSPYLAETLNYYAGLSAGQDALPPISRFDATMLPRHLANLYIVELRPAADGAIDYHYSMFGTGLSLLFGVNMAGKAMSEFPDRERVDRTAQVFRYIADTGLPVRTAGQFQTRNGMPVWGEALTMPFGEMGTVTHIVADLDYDVR